MCQDTRVSSNVLDIMWAAEHVTSRRDCPPFQRDTHREAGFDRAFTAPYLGKRNDCLMMGTSWPRGDGIVFVTLIRMGRIWPWPLGYRILAFPDVHFLHSPGSVLPSPYCARTCMEALPSPPKLQGLSVAVLCVLPASHKATDTYLRC